MATFRSDFNSVPNTYTDRLTAFKKKLTTCFQQWRHQLHKHHHQPKQRGSGQFYKIFLRADCSILGEKVTYLQKFKKVFTARQNLAGTRAAAESRAELVNIISQKKEEQEQQLQIVATLFSSTLISKYSSKNSINSDMTIIEDTYIGVRDDYPDIDAEIRAILLAHAQNGITISSIKSK